MSRLQVFVAVKGHAFARDAFEAMLRAVEVEPTFVDQPAASMLMNPDALRGYDAVLLYDMWGMDFRAPIDERPASLLPGPELVAGFEALLAEGKGIVALHHAIAAWPGWPAYSDALGGAFRYKPSEIRGRMCADSGYAADVSYRVECVGEGHPVLAGLPATFELTDELYRFEIFADDVEPLIRRATPIPDERYASAVRAVRRIADCARWQPPADNRLLGWAKAAGSSPLVYLQPGDGPETYADSNYRRLLGNALRWVASDDAKAWAARRSQRSPG